MFSKLVVKLQVVNNKFIFLKFVFFELTDNNKKKTLIWSKYELER
jgi:hypothetical protein